MPLSVFLFAAAASFVPPLPDGCAKDGQPIEQICGNQLGAAVLANYPNNVFFRNKDLVISPVSGPERIFNREESFGWYSTPKPLFVIEPFRLVLVYEWEWEGRDVFLVSLDTGEQINLDGWPLLSPDGKRILVYSEAIESNYYANIVAVYRLASPRPYLELILNGDDRSDYTWGPTAPAWDGPNAFHFTKEWWGENNERNGQLQKYQLENGKWLKLD